MNVKTLKSQLAKTQKELAAARRTIRQIGQENLRLSMSALTVLQNPGLPKPRKGELMVPVRKSREPAKGGR